MTQVGFSQTATNITSQFRRTQTTTGMPKKGKPSPFVTTKSIERELQLNENERMSRSQSPRNPKIDPIDEAMKQMKFTQPEAEYTQGLDDFEPSKTNDTDYFLNRARLTSNPKLSFGAVERTGNYLMSIPGTGLWQESRPPFKTYSREAIIDIKNRYDEMLSSRDMDDLTALEKAHHVQMCTDVAFGDSAEILGLQCIEQGELLMKCRKAYGWIFMEMGKEEKNLLERENNMQNEVKLMQEELTRMKEESAKLLAQTCQKYERDIEQVRQEKEDTKKKMNNLIQDHEAERLEIERRFNSFNSLLQKIRNDERLGKEESGAGELLQEKDKIIRMRERKIIELTDMYERDVKELRTQLEDMQSKASTFSEQLTKEKAKREEALSQLEKNKETPQRWVLPPNVCNACRAKFQKALESGTAVLLGSTSDEKDLIDAGESSKIGSRKNSRPPSREGNMAPVTGAPKTIIVQDPATTAKLNKAEKDLKMLSALSKVQEKTIEEQKKLFQEVIKKQMSTNQEQKEQQEKEKEAYKKQIEELVTLAKDLETNKRVEVVETVREEREDRNQEPSSSNNVSFQFGKTDWSLSEEELLSATQKLLKRIDESLEANRKSTSSISDDPSALDSAATDLINVLPIPPLRRLSLPLSALLIPTHTGLQPSLNWMIGSVRQIYADFILAQRGLQSITSGLTVLGLHGLTHFSDYVYIWIDDKYGVQKKQESARWALLFGIDLFRKDFPELFLFGKFLMEEYTTDEVDLFCFTYMALFEGGLPQPPLNETEFIAASSLDTCKKAIRLVFEGISESKITEIFSGLNPYLDDEQVNKYIDEEKKGRPKTKIDASAFLLYLLDVYRVEKKKRIDSMKVLFEQLLTTKENKGRANFSETYALLKTFFPSTTLPLALTVFRDAFRASGCQFPTFPSLLESLQRNNFFTLTLQLPNSLDLCDTLAPLTVQQNTAALKVVNRHISLLRPYIADRIRIWNSILTPVGIVHILSQSIRTLDDSLAKKQGRKSVFSFLKLLALLQTLQLSSNEMNGLLSFALPIGDQQRINALAAALRSPDTPTQPININNEREVCMDNLFRQFESCLGVLDPSISTPIPPPLLVKGNIPPFPPSLSSILPALGLYNPSIRYSIMSSSAALDLTQFGINTIHRSPAQPPATVGQSAVSEQASEKKDDAGKKKKKKKKSSD
ncbi:hypothetical protein BLNAU_4199 [Blattamonas nauphoetae]|uniref:Uncharacterized protein n=1 Tax=Blattamonas nauphoetae TaxID=2049346 RepID=A0ABQ9YAQ9_9EUKA|nr:hypothetical protein BLNAU_4199 [Blattamonas nauphoetae]